MITLSPDANLANADWTKQTWDLPYTSEEELKTALGPRYESFKKLPVYRSRPWALHKRVNDARVKLYG